MQTLPDPHYRRLKIIRSAYERERNPDWYDPTHLTSEQLMQINALLTCECGREVALTHADLISRSDASQNVVLAAFDASVSETANVIGIGVLIRVESLSETIARITDIAAEKDRADEIKHAFLARMSAVAIEQDIATMEFSHAVYRRLIREGLASGHRRLSVDLDITES